MSCNRDFHESLFSITRHMREAEGGDVACCGSFLPKFVSQLDDNLSPIGERFIKSLNKVLKTVVRGTRLILRQAAELQLGLNGINFRQTAITQHFKPVARKLITRRRAILPSKLAPSLPALQNKIKKNKNNINPIITYKNRNLKVDHVFDNVTSGGVVYWEYKAG